MRPEKAVGRAFASVALGIALGLAAPARVIASSAVPDDKPGLAEVNYWSDVVLASNDDVAARDAIVRHIDDLVPALTQGAPPRETLHGVVAGIDERNDRLTVRLPSNATSDFRVQDGLVFDAVHYGDAVELTVENIAGAKTIVGLSIE